MAVDGTRLSDLATSASASQCQCQSRWVVGMKLGKAGGQGAT